MTNFSSVYEMMHPLSRERKTHFWDWFDGDDLRSWWSTLTGSNPGSGAMNNTVDGGYRLTSGSVAIDDYFVIYPNDINHYSNTGSVYINIIKLGSASTIIMHSGLTETISVPTDTRAVLYHFNPTETNIIFVTSLNGTSTTVDTGVAYDTNWHVQKIELLPSSSTGTIDGALSAVSTTNLPDVALEPFQKITTRTTAAKTVDIRYMEVYNT